MNQPNGLDCCGKEWYQYARWHQEEVADNRFVTILYSEVGQRETWKGSMFIWSWVPFDEKRVWNNNDTIVFDDREGKVHRNIKRNYWKKNLVETESVFTPLNPFMVSKAIMNATGVLVEMFKFSGYTDYLIS